MVATIQIFVLLKVIDNDRLEGKDPKKKSKSPFDFSIQGFIESNSVTITRSDPCFEKIVGS